MGGKAKRARAAEEARLAADRGDEDEDASSSDSGSEGDRLDEPVRGPKRLKGKPAQQAAAPASAPAPAAAASGWRNKEKPLVLCSRGIPGRCVA